ncbi:hypothetical protein AB6Q56_07190 [Dechloromonas sp. ARDL1]|uniref:hypothetical protein n=1 Tax=Dechloromonas sp. ARDL1 TaxID=3322121 RepID=UPI003DA7812C
MKSRISTETALPGMSLSEAVLDDAGRVLVPDGAVLTESLIHSLLRRGVAALCVDQAVEEDPAEREIRHARIARSVAVFFRQAGDGAGTVALREAICAFRMERGA